MTIEGFKAWLVARGRTPETAQGYAGDVTAAQLHPGGPLGRLRMKSLAPKTLRRVMASLRAWCKYTHDTVLLEQLSDIRLPPPNRKIPKMPLTKEQWKALVLEINAAAYISHAERAVLGVMIVRGLRIGDLLRLERKQVLEAVRTGELVYKGKGSKLIQVGTKTFIHYLQLLAKEDDWNTVSDLISASGKPKSSAQQISRALKSVGEKAGISRKDLYPHRLRRSYAVMFLEAAGGDLEKLRAHLSWADLSTAAMYSDHNKKDLLEKLSEDMLKGLK